MSHLQSQVEPPSNLWISHSVFEAFITEAIQQFPYETGGVLMGYWGTAPAEPVVTEMIGPGPGAARTTESFRPDHDYHLQEISNRYHSSGNRVVYLGEWHTHPDGKPVLSTKDIKTLRRIAKYKPARAPNPIMLLLTGETWRASASVLWPVMTFWGRGLQLQSLKLRLFQEASTGK